ncbi:MAG: hemolysin family protein [Thermodesulfobacteriota bacterium]
MSEVTAGLISSFILLAASAFFCFAEGALFSLGRHQRESIRSEGGRKAEIIEGLLKKPGELIVTVLFADEAVNIGYSAAVAMVIASLMSSYSSETVTAVSIAVASPALLVFGETVPKTVAVRFPSAVAKAVASPLNFFHWLVTPLRRLIIEFSNLFVPLKAADEDPTAGLAQDFSEEDIEALVLMGREEGVVNDVESRLADRLFRLRDTSARSIMKPEIDCMTLSDSLSPGRMVYEIERTGYSRIPVYSGDRNDIRGIVYSKDLLLNPPLEDAALEDYLHTPYFIPGSKDAFDLLKEFRRRRIHMALVVDEYGRFDGLVTLEDILEEIVGEIEDERSISRKDQSVRWEGNALTAPGGYKVDDFNDEMLFPLIKFVGIEDFSDALVASAIPPREDGGQTLAGFVFDKFGSLPSEGQSISHGSLVFTVKKKSGKRISEITVQARKEENGE